MCTHLLSHLSKVNLFVLICLRRFVVIWMVRWSKAHVLPAHLWASQKSCVSTTKLLKFHCYGQLRKTYQLRNKEMKYFCVKYATKFEILSELCITRG